MIAAIFTEEGQDLRLEPRVERLEHDSRESQRKSSDDIAELKQRLHAIGLDIATIKGSLDGQKKPPPPWVTPLIGFAASALLFFWGWVATTIVQHGNTMASIRQSLLGLGITISAANPTSPKAQDQARESIAEAKLTSVPIPTAALEKAGKSFIDAATESDKAWDVALDLVSYRSSLKSSNKTNTEQVADPNGQDVQGVKVNTLYALRNEVGGKPKPAMYLQVDKRLGKIKQDDAARAEQLSRPIVQPPGFGIPTFIMQGGAILLDDMRLRHVILSDVEVHYSGGLASLEDVTFSNCTFVFDNVPNGRQLGQQILADSTVNFHPVG